MSVMAFMSDWGFAAAKALGFGDPSYHINCMYIEFENAASPGDPVTVPSFETTDGREYYENLSSPRDYLRVFGISRVLEVISGYDAYFADGEGNAVKFRATADTGSGQNGLPFANANNSTVFGVALVVAPDVSDKTKDKIVARAYYDVADQTVKEASRQIDVGLTLRFPPD